MAKPKKKKKSKSFHVTYNKKAFLAPDSIRSKAAIHTKILNDGTAIVRISDCNTSIRIWNDFNSKEEKQEMLEKVQTLQVYLHDFGEEIKLRL